MTAEEKVRLIVNSHTKEVLAEINQILSDFVHDSNFRYLLCKELDKKLNG